jgi:transposase InsO family protein
MDEWERARIVEACVKGQIKPGVAALRLQVSTRHFRRLQVQFAKSGVSGLISRRPGKPSNNQLAPGLAQNVLQIVRENYADFGPTLACEMLLDRHGVAVSKETVRRLMIEAGLRVTRREGQARLYQPRERRACLGELVQLDGSPHEWFEHRGDSCALLAFIDDATGQIMQLHFAETESTASYFDATRRYIERHGTPVAFYGDRAAVFRSAAVKRHAPTQFQRALDELKIALICANSPQAKGRVERLNRTLQDRMVKHLRVDGIDNIEAANAWCDQFAQKYNARYGRVPRSELDLHRQLDKKEDLALILAIRETRKLSAKLTVLHRRRQYVVDDRPEFRALIGQRVNVHTYADGKVELRADGLVLNYSILELPPLAGPIEADSKTLHHLVDKLVPATPARDRHYRHNQLPAVVAKGVKAAKTKSAQKRA